MSTPSRNGLDVEAILNNAEAKVNTLAEAAEWLRDKALMHYSRSEFSRKYPAFDRAHVNTGVRWSEMDLVDLGHMLTREVPIKEIASYLCRSQAEVRDKIAELGQACKDDPSRHHHRERRLALVGPLNNQQFAPPAGSLDVL
jgi:hypothetical protein